MNAIDLLKKLVRLNQKMEEKIAGLEYQIAAGQSPWMKIPEAAAYCGYKPDSFYKLYRNEIPYFKRDKSVMIRVEDLEAWMEKNKIDPVTPVKINRKTKAPVRAGANH